MDLGFSTMLIGAAIGLVIGLFGAKMLATGRAPASTQRAFRSVRDAGLYHLLFGVALLILVIGTTVKGPTAAVTSVLAVAMVAIAVIRFRPRGRRAAEESARDEAGTTAGESAAEKTAQRSEESAEESVVARSAEGDKRE
jgi:hypothetical protein